MVRAETLASAQNPLLKEVRRAAARGSLTADGYAVAEGFHLLDEALASDREVKLVLAAEPVRAAVTAHVQGLNGLRVVGVREDLFRSLSTTETSQGVIALVRPPEWTLDQILRGKTLCVVLDGVQDPGNAGAIVRAAEAFGATGAAFLRGSVYPWNPKTLRSSAGSLFRLPLVHSMDHDLLLAALSQRRVRLYAASPRAKRTAAESDLSRPSAIIIGSEGGGVRRQLAERASGVRIPTSGVESLNAAVAAGILLYEARRQRTPAA